MRFSYHYFIFSVSSSDDTQLSRRAPISAVYTVIRFLLVDFNSSLSSYIRNAKVIELGSSTSASQAIKPQRAQSGCC